jgi:hypothetical protein
LANSLAALEARRGKAGLSCPTSEPSGCFFYVTMSQCRIMPVHTVCLAILL